MTMFSKSDMVSNFHLCKDLVNMSYAIVELEKSPVNFGAYGQFPISSLMTGHNPFKDNHQFRIPLSGAIN